MTRRLEATNARPAVHTYVKSTDTPGACGRCHLIKANAVHAPEDDPRLKEQEQAQEEHRRRIGDQL